MSIRSGQIVTVGGGFVLDRLQTTGPSSLKIPQEIISEVGDPQTVAIVRDIPDLGFDMESFDESCEAEALLNRLNPTTLTGGEAFTFDTAIPLDVVSPFKSSLTDFHAYNGVVAPFLTLQQVDYKFAIKQNSSQSFKLVGDSLFYTPGPPRFESHVLSGTSYSFATTAGSYVYQNLTMYALGVCLKNPTTGAFKRLLPVFDYTDTSSGVTLNASPDVSTYSLIDIVYGTVAGTVDNYPQNINLPASSTKPGAVRAKDIDVYISNGASTPIYLRFNGVQSTTVSRKVTLEADQEFGNPFYVSQDYDVPDVSGEVVIKPTNPDDLLSKVQQIAQVSGSGVAGAFSGLPLGMEVRISDPATGNRLKTLYVPDALFNIPAFSSKVKSKATFTLPFQSQGGLLQVFNGARS